jgi:hypothetical protein
MRNRSANRSLLELSRPPLNWWQRLLGVVAFVAVVLMLINPEFLAFGFAMDAAFFDLLVLLITLQLQLIGSQTWSWIGIASAKLIRGVAAALIRSVLRTRFGCLCIGMMIQDAIDAICAVARAFVRRSRPYVITV